MPGAAGIGKFSLNVPLVVLGIERNPLFQTLHTVGVNLNLTGRGDEIPTGLDLAEVMNYFLHHTSIIHTMHGWDPFTSSHFTVRSRWRVPSFNPTHMPGHRVSLEKAPTNPEWRISCLKSLRFVADSLAHHCPFAIPGLMIIIRNTSPSLIFKLF